MDNNNNAAYDREGFEAFFKAHPNDATIAEDLPATTSDPDSTDDDDTNTNTDTGAGDNGTSDTGAGDQNNNSTSSDTGAEPPAGDANKATDTKQAQAFAQMRIANQQQTQLIKQIAGVLGVDNTKDPQAMMTALQQLTVKAQAQKQGIPEEVLSRINQLENVNLEYQRQQAYLAAGRGFQTIKDKYGLDDDGLEAFAQELIADGINPYERPVDLVSEYKLRHFDDLIAQATQKGIDQEAQRAAKAGAQGSTPSDTTGGRADSDPPKINSVAELNKWLDENK